jgi:iron complex outermembrane recepter protein
MKTQGGIMSKPTNANRVVCALMVATTVGGLGGIIPCWATGTEDTASPALEEITVTARKRTEALQDVPISEAVTSSVILQEYNVRDVTDVQNFVPGMVLSRAADDGLGLTFRGIGSPPRNQSFENSVGMFVDGVFFGQGRLYFAAFFDLYQIEFVKGTQSTLLGKNTSLGAISIATKKPGDEWGGKITADANLNNGGGSGEAAFDMPFSDKFKVRTALLYTNLHGGFHNVVTGNNLPIDDNIGARITADWKISSTVDTTLMYQYFRDLHIGSGNQVVLDPNHVLPVLGAIRGVGPCVLCTQVDEYTPDGDRGTSFHNTHGDIASVLLNADLAGYTVTSQTAYVNYGLHDLDAVDAEDNNQETFDRTEKYYQYTEEFRITSPTHQTFEYIAGLFFLGSHWDSKENQDWAIPGFPPPPAPISGQLFNGSFLNDFTQKVTSYSIFGNGAYHFTNEWRFTMGLRQTDEYKDVVFGRFAGPPLTIWNTVANPSFPATPLRFSDKFLNGNADLQYDFTHDFMVYGSVAQGTKTGGFADGVTIPSGNPEEARIKSETATTYELGEKATLLNGAARLDAALYFTNVRNYQETEFTGVAFLTKNIPLQSKGVDLSGQWQVTTGLSVFASGVYADAVDTSTHTRPAAAPQWTANLGTEYKQPLPIAWSPVQLYVGASAHYRDAQYNQIEQSIPETPPLTTVDVNLGIGSQDGKWKASLIGRNVFNKLEAQFSYPSPDPFLAGVIFGESNPPRSILLQGEYSF